MARGIILAQVGTQPQSGEMYRYRIMCTHIEFWQSAFNSSLRIELKSNGYKTQIISSQRAVTCCCRCHRYAPAFRWVCSPIGVIWSDKQDDVFGCRKSNRERYVLMSCPRFSPLYSGESLQTLYLIRLHSAAVIHIY